MRISGALPSFAGLAPLRAVPLSAAQEYVRRLEGVLAADDSAPVFFVDDGVTGTCDDLVYEALETLQEVLLSKRVFGS